MSEQAQRIVEELMNGDQESLRSAIVDALNSKREILVNSYKTVFAEEILFEEDDEDLDEADGPRLKRVNRIRGGVVQRRKIVTRKAGYKVQNGRVVRMSAIERKRRQLAQKKAARKRKGTLTRALRKRTRSLKIRKSRGL